MKKPVAIILLLATVFLMVCCRAEPDSYGLLIEFVNTYGADGVIYSPIVPEGKDGYIKDGFVETIYLFYGRFPENYAIFLNSRPDFSSECGIFVCSDAEMVDIVEEMCLERIRLLCSGDKRAFVKRNHNVVFYSTLPDRERAEKIFSEIIR